jgi:hypothetical protein
MIARPNKISMEGKGPQKGSMHKKFELAGNLSDE